MKRETEAFLSANMFKVGLGHVLVARFRASGLVEVGVFLVDTYCLGVKSAFYTRADQAVYDREILDDIMPPDNRMPIAPPSARKLVEGAVAYAKDLGFNPHPDYKKACRVFGGINPSDSTASFPYGKDGKPFYMQGPHDSFQLCLRILKQLRSRCGDDNFHFTVCVDENGEAKLRAEGFNIRQKMRAPMGLTPF